MLYVLYVNKNVKFVNEIEPNAILAKVNIIKTLLTSEKLMINCKLRMGVMKIPNTNFDEIKECF